MVFGVAGAIATPLDIVNHEFNRLFECRKATNLPGTCWIERKAEITSLLRMFVSNEKHAATDAVPLQKSVSPQTCSDLKLLCGDEKQESAALLLNLQQPTSAAGLLSLAQMLITPQNDLKLLSARAALINLLREKTEINKKFSAILQSANGAMPSVVQLLNADSERDSFNLLNSSFGIFWENRTYGSLIPGKMQKKIKPLLNQQKNPKVKKNKKQKSWLASFVDRSDFLLSVTLFITAVFVGITQMRNVASLGKDVGETYNFGWAHRWKKFFKTNCVSWTQFQESEAHCRWLAQNDFAVIKDGCALDSTDRFHMERYLNGLLNFTRDAVPMDDMDEGFEGQSLYKRVMAPRWRQQIEQDIQLLQEGLGLEPGKDGKKAVDPKVLVFDTSKIAGRCLKPLYACIAPGFTACALARECNRLRLAYKKARQEVDDLAQLLIAGYDYIALVDQLVAAQPELQDSFQQMKELQTLRKFLKQTEDKELYNLIEALLEKPRYNIGKFLRVYKQLHQKIKQFVPLVKAVGELDVYLTLAKIAQDPTFCFPQYLPNSDGHELEIKNFWDPKIGNGNCIKNSIHLDSQTRGMIITGSNAGGKSSFMRAAVQAALLAQTICLVPAETARLVPFANFFTLMGKVDDPGSGRSLYRVEAEAIAGFLQQVKMATTDQPLLACIDEMFSSTEPVAACKLAYAVILNVAANPAAFTLLATHISGITSAQEATGGVFKNFKVLIQRDDNGNFVKNNYTVIPGCAAPEDSTAFDVAKLAGIEEAVINQAKQL